MVEQALQAALSRLPEGEVRAVVLAPHSVLSHPCEDADPESPETFRLVADLIATMRVSPGCVGLAANQIGVNQRVFVMDVSLHPKTRIHHGLVVMINPIIEEATRNERGREGCMSVPDLTVDVKRATRLAVSGYVPGSRDRYVLETDAFEARAVAHEVDHLDGFLILDRAAGAHAIHQRQTYL